MSGNIIDVGSSIDKALLRSATLIEEIESFGGRRSIELERVTYRLSADESYAKADDYYVGTQLLRQILSLFRFDENRIGSYRFEHKLVQSVILNSYVPGLVPPTAGAAALINGLSVEQALAEVTGLYRRGFFLKATVGEASGELGLTDIGSKRSAHLISQLNARYSGSLESESYVFQKRLRIHKEYRVHTFQNEVIEGLTFHRHASVIPADRDAQRINHFIQDVLDHLPNALIRDSLYGWDVAESESGTLSVIEANPTGNHQEYRPGFHCSGYFQVPAWSVLCLGRFCLHLNSRYGCEFELLSGKRNIELSQLYRLLTLYSTNRSALRNRGHRSTELALKEVFSVGYSTSMELNTLCWVAAENSLSIQDDGQPDGNAVRWKPALDGVGGPKGDVAQLSAATLADESDNCIHRLVEQQVTRSPNCVALSSDGYSLTYTEMNQWANEVAETLLERGVGPEKLVAVCLKRSPLLIVTLLAVLKAGGAYVPIDTNMSEPRLEDLLKDSQPQLFVTTEDLSIKFRSISLIQDTLIIQNTGQMDRQILDKTNHEVKGTSLCYVLYTSGSTGKPKGVMIEHRSVINQLTWMQDNFPLCQDDVVLLKTPYTFDVSVWEIFWPLMYGARVVIAKPEGHLDPHYLARIITLYGVTLIQFVPSMLHRFSDVLTCTVGATLRRILSIGEVLPTKLALKVKNTVPNIQLINLYGPTETSIAATSWICDDLVEGEEIPIGLPMKRVNIYILNARGQLVSGSEEGEIYVGGVQVARGYRNNPFLTRQKFITDPFTVGDETTVMYATGDKGRWRHGNILEYLGRVDNEIKFYGHRIDPRDIESLIELFPGIRQAVVVLSELETDQTQLVAFYVSQSLTIRPEHLVSYLSKSLPSAIVPLKYVALNFLPTTPAGKADRKALAALADREILNGSQAIDRETTLTAILLSFLSPRQVSVSSSMLEEGLDSLAILRLANKIREAFGFEIDIAWLFTDDASISRIAAVLHAGGVRTDIVRAK